MACPLLSSASSMSNSTGARVTRAPDITLAIRRGAAAALLALGIRARHGMAVLRIHVVWTAGSQISQRARAGAADAPGPDLECLLSQVAGGDRDAFEAVCHL